MGSGFLDFSAGAPLTADQVDGYLMRQSVMTFATATARDTDLSGVLDEGMVAYLEDSNIVTIYTGSAWAIFAGRVGGLWKRNANQSIPNASLTAISWDLEIEDTHGFATPTTSTITIPSGCGGVYLISASVSGLGNPATTNGTLRIVAAGYTWDFPSNGFSGFAGATVSVPMNAADTIVASAYQSSGSAQNLLGHITVYMVSN